MTLYRPHRVGFVSLDRAYLYVERLPILGYPLVHQLPTSLQTWASSLYTNTAHPDGQKYSN